MKTTLKNASFLLLCVTAFCQNAAAQDLSTFKSVVPNLKLLESGFPAVKNIDVNEYSKYEATPETGTFKFAGIIVTSDMIKEKLGSLKPTVYSIDAKAAVNIKKLVIYCDSLSLTDTLWLPQCNIEIQARIVNMSGKCISSSALPWRKSIDRNALNESDEADGRDGLDAGDISIICDKIVSPGKVIANGTPGEWTNAPKISIDWPGVATHIECYKNMGCSNQGNGRSLGMDAGKDWKYNMAATVFFNEDHTMFDHEDCTGYVTWDKGGIEFQTKDGVKSAIKDNKAARRIVGKANKPGKGGKSGKITLYYSSQGAATESTGGKTGFFKPRRNTGDVTYFSAGDGKCNGISYDRKRYDCYEIYVKSNTFGDISWRLHWENRQYNSVYIPDQNAVNNFNNALSLNAPNKNGDNVATDIRKIPYIPNGEYFLVRVKYLQEQYSIYHKKTAAQQKELDKEANELLQQLSNVIKDKANDPAKADYLTAYDRILTLSQTSIKNLDEYNNEPGYRPLLSITSTLSYIKNNLESDLRLYVLSDIMARSEQSAGAFKQKIPGMLKDLYAANKGLSDKMVEINKKYDGLAIKAEECDKKIEVVAKKLDTLERKIKEQAKSDQQKLAILKAGIKVCALAASVIPYGQPALGQIAGNGLSALADNITESPDKIALSVMEKVDLGDVLKSLAKKQLKGVEPKKMADRELIDVSGMENVSVDVLRYNDEILAEKNKDEKKKYDDKLTKTKETYTKATTGVKDILANYSKASVNKDEIEKKVAELTNGSLLFNDIRGDLKELTDQKEEIFSELSDLLQESYSINSQIIENSDCISKLQAQHLGGLKYNKGLEDVMKDIREASLVRLKWIEYQLVKVYEYTTLTTYKQKMPTAEILEEVYGRQKGTATPDNVDKIVQSLATAYIGQQTIMGNQILLNISTSHRQDGSSDPEKLGKYGRKVLLVSDKKQTPEGSLLDHLNEHHNVIVDLQKDLVEEIIKPSEAETRIIDVALDAIEFGNVKLPESASLDVILDIEDGGVLRKNDAFYLFQVGDKEHAADRWKWTIRNVNGKNKITNASQLSSQYKDLIRFMTGTESAKGKEDNENLFTLPPAWSRCKIRLRYNGSGLSADNMPQVSKLMFSMRCDYVDVSNKNKNVLDIKLQDAPAGVLYTTTVDRTVQTHYANLYELMPNNKEITIDLKEPAGDANEKRKFIKWDVYGGHASKDPSGKKITLKLTDDTRVVAVYGEATAPMGAATIPLYESASLNARVIAWINAMNEVQVVEENVNGFTRVVFNGAQEAFIKK